jgi:hypothetical protein
VLDDAYDSIDAQDDIKKDALIKEELTKLSNEYGQLTSKTILPINYSFPAKRFAYIYKYTVAHADYIMQVIKNSNELRSLFSTKSVEIACLGGGPGSDLLGILKYLIKNNQNKDLTLNFFILDKERAWGDSWSDVAKQLDSPFKFSLIFQQMDATDSETWKSYNKFLKANLFTLSYFLSEVFRFKDQAEPFFMHCMSQMKSGSFILFVDNNNSHFTEWFDEMAEKQGLKVLTSSAGELVFTNEEHKEDLGEYFEKFGWPRRRGDVAWRIMKKP